MFVRKIATLISNGNNSHIVFSKGARALMENLSLNHYFKIAALIAMVLGGLHALEAEHGKTVAAEYLPDRGGMARHPVLSRLIVRLSDTGGVFALGAILLYASRYIVPEQLSQWLAVLCGMTIVAVGVSMLLRCLIGTTTHHDHEADTGGGHWFSSRQRGMTGGIVPCPAALVVLLSALALHRTALGFLLMVMFSLGLAGGMIGFGMLIVCARRLTTHLQVDGPLTRRWLPTPSASFILALGVVVTWQGFAAIQLHLRFISPGRLGPLLFVAGLGLILGMRHSTDADHVVAISTIVSKQRSVRGAALIGSMWGIGHTITIFIVGSLIILFNVEIPPRLGLSMEFSVAVMLVLLGIMNLSGAMQWITRRFASYDDPNSDSRKTSAASLTFQERILDRTVRRFGLYHFVRPLVIGLVHGLAGSAAVALLVLSTIHDPLWATFYLLIFGAGTMIGMMCMTAAIAVPLTYFGGRFTRMTHYLNFASGMASLCFGSFLVYQLGFLGGLFGSHPQWTPR